MADDTFDAAAAVSKYLSGAAPTPETTLRASLQDAVGQNPDQAADWRRTAATIGVPVDTAQALPDWSKQQKALADIDTGALARMNPATTSFLSSPENAAVAHDDTASLSAIETVIGALAGAAKYVTSAPGAAHGGALSDVGRAARAVASGLPSAGAGLYGAAAAPLELVGLDHLGGFLRDQQQQAQGVAKAWMGADPKAGLVERGIYSGLQSAGQNFAMLPLGFMNGARITGEQAMLGAMGLITGGQSYGKGRDAGLSPARAIPYAVEDATAEIVTEKYLGAAGFLKNIKAGASAGKLFMYELAKEVPGEMAATLWQNFNEWTNVNQDKSVADFISEQPEALAETVIATLVGGTTQIGAIKGLERATGAAARREQQAQAAEQSAGRIEELGKLVEASKLRARDPESFRAFVEQVGEQGEQPAELFINAETLANTLNQSGFTMAELQAVAPSVAAQLQPHNLVPGADIRIPTSELLAAPAELTATLTDHLRTGPEAMSRAEAGEYLATQGEQIQREVEVEMARHEDRAAYQAQVDQARDHFQTQLDAVGRFRPDVNKAYATLLGNFYAAQAARADMPLAEFMQKYRLGFSSQEAAGRQKLDQGTEAAAAPARGTLSFGHDLTQGPSIISLLQGADLTTTIHEVGHFFLEVQADLAARIVGRIQDGDIVMPGERQIVADMDTVLKSFGITGTPDMGALTTWLSMTLEEKREHHENFARGFERYAMEGRAPSQEMQALFQRFRSWLVSVYKVLAGLNVKLTDDVRAVMDRMLATDAAIQQAQDARAMGPLFASAEQAGMTPEEYAAYQELGRAATDAADAELDARLLKDMKWMGRAKDKALKARQAEVAGLRAEVEMGVRGEVMAEPVYRAWAFLTGRGRPQEAVAGEKAAGRARGLDPARDNLFEAIAKLGGLNKAAVVSQWGHKDPLHSGVFGAPLLRKEGLSFDAMAERLIEAGYLLPDMHGKADLAKFEQLFDDQARGTPRYSIEHEWALREDVTADPVDGADALHGKLSTPDLKNRYGEAADALWRQLSARRMTSPEGLDVDVVAETFGFASGDQLARALAAATPPRDAIAALTDQRMLERHGDIASPQALERAAEEAIHNEVRARVIATELRALARAGSVRESGDSLYGPGSIDVMARAAREYAAQVVVRLRLKDIRPKQYAAAEARSAKLAEQSLGNTQEAALHKRNQLVNNFAAKAAYEAQAEVAAANAFFKRIIGRSIADIGKTRDVGTAQAARAVLAAYGIGTKGEAAQGYLATMERDDPGMHAVLSDKVNALTANAKPVSEMTVEEFRGLVDEVKGLWHMAKRARQVEVDGKMVDVESVKGELVARLEDIGIPERVAGEGRAVTEGERRLSRLQTLGAALRRVESWVGAKDGSEAIGPFRRYVWQPVKEAADRYRADRATYIKRYRDLLSSLDVGKSRIDAPELGYVFGFSRGGSGKAEILHALLHTGNESNKRKLLLGRGWGQLTEAGALDTGRWDAFVRRMVAEGALTKKDFDFAQGVWDLLEDTKALAQRAHRDVFGRYFDEVTANEFAVELPAGPADATGKVPMQVVRYRGGYVPAMTDAEIVKDAATRALQEDENQTLAYAFPSTAKGFTKARVEYNRPLLLDLRTLSTHIDKVLLFSHMEGPVRDVRKVLASRDVSEPLHRVDPTAFDSLLTPWLNRAARQTVETKVPGSNGLMRFFAGARQRAGLAAMFANVSNTAQQVTGLSIAALKVRPTYLMEALAQSIIAPRQTARAVAGASIYMATRMDNEVEQMAGAINDILLNPGVYEQAQAWTARHAYFMQSAVDNFIGPIVWNGAYNQALEAGHDQADAIRLADSAVRETQGSTLPEDVSRIETGNAFVRMFSQFAGYFNMQANLLGTEFARTYHELGLRRGAGRGLYVFILGFVVPNMLAELIAQAFKGGPDDEDKDGSTLDDWLMAVLLMGNVRAGLAMVPGVGTVANAAINMLNKKPYDDRISTSPAVGMLESSAAAVTLPIKLARGDTVDGRKAVRDVATLISMTTGLPATAIARPAGYLAAMSEGKVTPTGPVDAARGLVSGTPSPESKR